MYYEFTYAANYIMKYIYLFLLVLLDTTKFLRQLSPDPNYSIKIVDILIHPYQ